MSNEIGGLMPLYSTLAGGSLSLMGLGVTHKSHPLATQANEQELTENLINDVKTVNDKKCDTFLFNREI